MAAELGIAGVAACGLAVRRDQDWHPLGALTVYAEAPGAFDILRVASQGLNVRLQELATRLTETGELPG